MDERARPPLQHVWRAFLATQAVLLAVGWAMRPTPSADGASFAWLLLGGGAPLITAAWAVAPRWLRSDDPRERLVPRWVCGEIVGVCGMAALAYGGPGWIGTTLVVWGAALVAAARPEEGP